MPDAAAPGRAELEAGAPGDATGTAIEALEAEIERLSVAAEHCRKTMRLAGVATASGGVALVLMLVGAVPFNPLAFLAALTALVGGFPLHGSTRSTLEETLAARRAHEARRAELIDGLRLHPVRP